MNRYLYYPGCAMEASARAYEESLHAIRGLLGLELDTIRDWNCCGATESFGISLTPAYALIGRNLALAARQADGTKTVVASCSACYLNLAKADHFMEERPLLNERVNAALAAGGLSYEPGTLEIRHLLDVIVHDIGLEAVRQRVVRPLTGLKVAPYLGCMVPRPDYGKHWSDHEHPDELDLLLRALGADVIDFPLAAHCCGGHMPHIGPETAFDLIRRLIAGAARYGADLMVTVCPMCQINVDAYQREANRHFGTDERMPIAFFTQVMGLAFGFHPSQIGFGRELTSAKAALAKVPAAARKTDEESDDGKLPERRRPDDKSLPWPRMPRRKKLP